MSGKLPPSLPASRTVFTPAEPENGPGRGRTAGSVERCAEATEMVLRLRLLSGREVEISLHEARAGTSSATAPLALGPHGGCGGRGRTQRCIRGAVRCSVFQFAHPGGVFARVRRVPNADRRRPPWRSSGGAWRRPAGVGGVVRL